MVRIRPSCGGVRAKAFASPGPQQVEGAHEFERQVSQQCAEEPQTREDSNQIAAGDQVTMAPHVKAVRGRGDDEEERDDIDQADHHAQPYGGPVGGKPPNGAIPKALGKKQRGQNRQKNGETKKEPAPIQRIYAPSTNF